MKIALLKQDVYQDLYVGDKEFTAKELLFSSLMRVGPIGLFTIYGADFYIIKEAKEHKECRIWEEVLDIDPKVLRSIKNQPFKESDYFREYASFKVPGSKKSHSNYSVSYDSVDWSIYDIVISINICLPSDFIKLFPSTLWCYMIGEANKFTDRVYFGYDCCLNQENRGYITSKNGIVDFPYTFVGPDCLKRILDEKEERTNSYKRGIYLEINNTKERPFNINNHLKRLEETGHNLIIHNQLIRENLLRISRSKYFLKVEGRLIRGNGIYEAISCGSLVLCNPHLLIHTQVLPQECWVFSIDDAISRIKYLDRDPQEFNRLLLLQKSLLKHFVLDCPMESLINEHRRKLEKTNNRSRLHWNSRMSRLISKIKRTLLILWI